MQQCSLGKEDRMAAVMAIDHCRVPGIPFEREMLPGSSCLEYPASHTDWGGRGSLGCGV